MVYHFPIGYLMPASRSNHYPQQIGRTLLAILSSEHLRYNVIEAEVSRWLSE